MTATALAEPQRAERARAAPAARRSSAPARRPRAPVQREHELHVVGARRLAPLRRKLEVGRSDDPLEHEADRVAARVLAAPVLRRACACGGTPGPDGECAACKAGRLELRRRSAGERGGSRAPPLVHQVLATPGRPLDAAMRSFFEPRLGHDLGHVRVHTGERAERSAQEIGALAYAVGPQLVFGPGSWSPDSDAGRRLLAHELAHTLEDAPGPTLRRQQQPQQQQQQACAQAIAELKTESLAWLDDAISQLITYQAWEIFPEPAGAPLDPVHARVGRTLQRTFNTKDLWYADVIEERLAYVARSIRSGRLAIFCPQPGDPSCGISGGGSSFTAAYVVKPYELHLCSLGVPGARPTATFVHEVVHAVVPQVGITAPLRAQGEGVRDRAYSSERLFRYLSPEEALDNAESYGMLVQQLAKKLDVDVATSAVDVARGCADPTPVRDSIARFEQWTRDAESYLEALAQFLSGGPGRTLQGLADADIRPLTANFPAVTTAAGIRTLRAFYGQMTSAMSQKQEIVCAPGKGLCATAGVLGFGSEGSVAADAVTLKKLKAVDLNVCPAWLSADQTTRTSSLYTLFIITRPSWMLVSISLPSVMAYVRLARDAGAFVTPPPTGKSAMEHLFHDLPPAQPAAQGGRRGP